MRVSGMHFNSILASRQFLFRAELDLPNATPGVVIGVGDLEMASRLSFFLWSSIPDDELVNVEAKGKLRIRRCSRAGAADAGRPRSEALARNFAGQWLFLGSPCTSSGRK